MVNASALHGKTALSRFVGVVGVVSIVDVHKPDRVHFWSETLRSSIQECLTYGGFINHLVIEETVEAVEEVLALLGLTWKRNKSLSLSWVLFRRCKMLAQTPGCAGESCLRTRNWVGSHGED